MAATSLNSSATETVACRREWPLTRGEGTVPDDETDAAFDLWCEYQDAAGV